MHMETLSYPIVPSPALVSAPMSPPMTPTDGDQFSSNCGSHLYSNTQFAETSYNNSTTLHDPYSKFDNDDTNNNNNIYSTTDDDFYGDSISSEFSNLSVCQEEDTASNTTEPRTSIENLSSDPITVKKSKKNSRSKSKTSTSSEDSTPRKDSFVYDVRLPDEQFLFFVPDLDLVKSHLMFAVREEVDVLKDRIVELMDRINQLECENSMLRQYATQEVLQQIQAQLPHQIQQPSHHSSTS